MRQVFILTVIILVGVMLFLMSRGDPTISHRSEEHNANEGSERALVDSTASGAPATAMDKISPQPYVAERSANIRAHKVPSLKGYILYHPSSVQAAVLQYEVQRLSGGNLGLASSGYRTPLTETATGIMTRGESGSQYAIGVPHHGTYRIRFRQSGVLNAVEVIQTTSECPTTRVSVFDNLRVRCRAGTSIDTATVGGTELLIARDGTGEQVLSTDARVCAPCVVAISTRSGQKLELLVTESQTTVSLLDKDELAVRVMDNQGQPVPGAHLECLFELDAAVSVRSFAVADPSGRAALAVNGVGFALRVHAEGFDDRLLVLIRNALDIPLDVDGTPLIRMQREGELGGRVVSPDIAACSGRDVFVYVRGSCVPILCGRTDSGGRFHLSQLVRYQSLKPGEDVDVVAVVLEREQWINATFRRRLSDFRGERTELVIPMPEGRTMTAIVKDKATGELVSASAAEIRSTPFGAIEAPCDMFVGTQAIHNGTGVIAMDPGCTSSVTIKAQGYAPTTMGISLETHQGVAEFELTPVASAVLVQVLDTECVPLAGLRVKVKAIEPELSQEQVTDEHGMASLAGDFTGARLSMEASLSWLPMTPLPLSVSSRPEPYLIMLQAVHWAPVRLETTEESPASPKLVWLGRDDAGLEYVGRVQRLVDGTSVPFPSSAFGRCRAMIVSANYEPYELDCSRLAASAVVSAKLTPATPVLVKHAYMARSVRLSLQHAEGMLAACVPPGIEWNGRCDSDDGVLRFHLLAGRWELRVEGAQGDVVKHRTLDVWQGATAVVDISDLF